MCNYAMGIGEAYFVQLHGSYMAGKIAICVEICLYEIMN